MTPTLPPTALSTCASSVVGIVDQRDAAQEGGRGEARHVADDPAAEGDERRGAVGVDADERVVDPRDGGQLLVALAVGHEDRIGGVDRARHLLAVEPPDERAGDDEPACRGLQFVEGAADAIDRAVADRDRVGALTGRDVDADGAAGSIRSGCC